MMHLVFRQARAAVLTTAEVVVRIDEQIPCSTLLTWLINVATEPHCSNRFVLWILEEACTHARKLLMIDAGAYALLRLVLCPSDVSISNM